MFNAKVKPFRSTGSVSATTDWEKIWSKRKPPMKEIVAVLYGDGDSAGGVARFEFTFDDDDAISAGTPKFEHWALGDVTVNDLSDPPLVANDILPAPTGFRVVVISGTVEYIVAGR